MEYVLSFVWHFTNAPLFSSHSNPNLFSIIDPNFGAPVTVHVNSERVELHGQHIIQVITSLILKNGDLVQIHMSAPQHSDNNEAPRSILSSFVDLRNGDAVDIPPSHNTDDNVCKNGLYRHTLQYGQGNIKVSAACFLQNTLALAGTGY